MDIGTGKDIAEYCCKGKNIKYHLIDILDPSENYSVYDFQKDFYNSYNTIIQRHRMPILCGGTGLYIESILLDYDLSTKPPPDQELRDSLYKQSKDELLEMRRFYITLLQNLFFLPFLSPYKFLFQTRLVILHHNPKAN